MVADLTEDRRALIERARKLADTDSSSSSWSPLQSPSAFVTLSMQFTAPQHGARSIATGKATAVIDTSSHDALAYTFMYCSRERMRINVVEEGNLARLVIRDEYEHDQVVAAIPNMPFPLRPREFVVRQVCATGEDGELVLATESVSKLLRERGWYYEGTGAIPGIQKGANSEA